MYPFVTFYDYISFKVTRSYIKLHRYVTAQTLGRVRVSAPVTKLHIFGSKKKNMSTKCLYKGILNFTPLFYSLNPLKHVTL